MKTYYAHIRLTNRERKLLAQVIRIHRTTRKFTRKDAHNLAWVLFA
jgi:Mn-dependent DtxR family transcriptional regulator